MCSRCFGLGATAIACALLAGCERPASVPVRADSTAPRQDRPVATPAGDRGPASVSLGNLTFRITGPYAHRNLAVYMLHTDAQDRREFITLPEGLKRGQVKVSEKKVKEVNELGITNLSDRPLFLQEGDRLKGGDQDRIVYSSLVIPPGVKGQPLPAFCVEPNRWEAGARGREFVDADSAALAPRAIREAAKVEKDQGRVWASVANEKQAARQALSAPSATSSLNETLDSVEVQKATQEYMKALGGALQGQPDAIGIAIALNGTVEEVDIYPTTALLAQLYPRLLQSYAVEAAAQPATKSAARPPATDEVAQLMRPGGERSGRDERINAWNSLSVRELDGRVDCMTRYNGLQVHRQFLRQEASPEATAPR
jgi:hypothetical protein